VRQQTRDVRTDVPIYPYLGPDGVAGGTDQIAGPMVDEDFFAPRRTVLFPVIQWLSSEKVGALYKSNPNYFGATERRRPTQRHHRGIEYARETISAGYVRADVQLLEASSGWLAVSAPNRPT
jgi:hypothetical protein